MRATNDIQTYRVLLRGEGIDRQGGWVGFFTARQVDAKSEAAAAAEAVKNVLSRWPREGAEVLAEVHHVSSMVIKQVRLPWFRRLRGGFTFFNADRDAEASAERIERQASRFP